MREMGMRVAAGKTRPIDLLLGLCKHVMAMGAVPLVRWRCMTTGIMWKQNTRVLGEQ